MNRMRNNDITNIINTLHAHQVMLNSLALPTELRFILQIIYAILKLSVKID